MSRTARLGAFIFGALLVFALMIFLIGERQFLFSRTYRVKAVFDNVAGLGAGAAVRAGGVRVGTVEKIQLPQKPGEQVQIEMELEEATREVIKQDSVAAIETEGLLGSKYVTVSFGSAQSGRLRDGDMLPSRPPLDYADLAKKANAMMDTAQVAIGNVTAATENLKSITGKIDGGDGTIGALINDQTAYRNFNTAATDLRSIVGKIDGGEGTIGALINDRTAYQNLNAMTASLREITDEAKVGVISFQENMEALKHNWFLRGFFKDRGYFDSSTLTKYAINKLPEGAPLKTFTITDKDLFDDADSAKLDKEKLLNEVGKYLETNSFGLAVVVAYTTAKGQKEENLTLSQARAAIVRQYLAEKFRVDDARIKTLGQGEASSVEASGERVEIRIYADGTENRIVETKNQ